MSHRHLTPPRLFPRRPWRVYGDHPAGTGPGPRVDEAVRMAAPRPVELTKAEADAMAAAAVDSNPTARAMARRGEWEKLVTEWADRWAHGLDVTASRSRCGVCGEDPCICYSVQPWAAP